MNNLVFKDSDDDDDNSSRVSTTEEAPSTTGRTPWGTDQRTTATTTTRVAPTYRSATKLSGFDPDATRVYPRAGSLTPSSIDSIDDDPTVFYGRIPSDPNLEDPGTAVGDGDDPDDRWGMTPTVPTTAATANRDARSVIDRCNRSFEMVSWSTDECNFVLRCLSAASAAAAEPTPGTTTTTNVNGGRFLDEFQSEFSREWSRFSQPNLILQILILLLCGGGGDAAPRRTVLRTSLHKRRYDEMVDAVLQLPVDGTPLFRDGAKCDEELRAFIREKLPRYRPT